MSASNAMLVKKYFNFPSLVEFRAEWARLTEDGRAELMAMVEAEVAAGRFSVA